MARCGGRGKKGADHEGPYVPKFWILIFKINLQRGQKIKRFFFNSRKNKINKFSECQFCSGVLFEA